MTPTRRPIPLVLPLAAAMAALLVPGPSPASAQEADSADAGEEATTGAGQGITPEELASLLPEEVDGGFRRTDRQSGMRQGQPGARAEYEGSGGTVHVTIGTVPSVQQRLVPMLESRAEREESVEATSFRDHRAFQGQLQGRRQVLVAVGGYMAVSAATTGDVPLDRLRGVLEALDWERIESMAGTAGGEEGG